MHIQYLVPGPMSKGPMGKKEVLRRQALLNDWAFSGTDVSVVDVPEGPPSIESSYEELLAVPATLKGIQQAEQDGLDAVIIGCFGDPGLEAARELTTMPIIGPGESSMLLAASLGHRFSVITVLDNVIAAQEQQAYRTGVITKLASVLSADIPVLELMNDKAATLKRMIQVGTKAVKDDRADVLVLGCMTMSFLGIAEDLSKTLGVPVINAGRAALKAAETLISQNMSHSKKAFPTPPKFLKEEVLV